MTSCPPTIEHKRPVPLWWRIARTLLIGLFVSTVVAYTLHIQTQMLPDFMTELVTDSETGEITSELQRDRKATVWFVEQFGYLAPLLATMIIPYLLYRKVDRHDGKVQRELTWITVMVMALTFLVLLPYVAKVSDAELQAALAAGEDFPKRDGGAYDTLLLNVAPWFIRLFIGLCMLLLYHSMRAHREKQETVAALAVEASAATAPDTDAPVSDVEAQPSTEAETVPDEATAETP